MEVAISGNPTSFLVEDRESRSALVQMVHAWANAGFALIPIRPDGSKAPIGLWKGIADGVEPPPSVERLCQQITSNRCDGVAIVAGLASGNAEILELEGRAADRLADIVAHAAATGISDLLERLRSGCVEESPSGGFHFLYRVSDGPARPNEKLARRPDATQPNRELVLAETRGQGGYMICAGSFGRTHETGRPYKLLVGTPSTIPFFTMAERDELFGLFRVIDEMPLAPEERACPREQIAGSGGDDGALSPGDDFNRRSSWDELLEGWVRVTTSTDPAGNQRVHWRRPGKSVGTSATTGGEGDRLYIFSSSTPLPHQTALSKFAVYSYLNHGGNFSAAAAELAEQGYGSRPAGRRRPTEVAGSYKLFPVDALPGSMRAFIEAGAAAANCDPAHIAMPALAAVAAAIGCCRQLKLKSSWALPAILWTATVGESGSKKSVGSMLALKPVEAIEGRNERRYRRELQDHDRQVANWERQMADWKKSKQRGPAPEEPNAPHAARAMVDNTTVEALAPLLKSNPRGLLLAKDELKGWLGSFDRYASVGGSGADESHWLTMYNARMMVIDRKTGKHPTIHVPRAAVSITGNIPPGILKRAFNTERRESGLAARFLLACPPQRRVRWTEATIPQEVEQAYHRLFEELYSLQPHSFSDGEVQPVDVELCPGAKALYTAFYDQHNEEKLDLVGDLAAVWSKLEETAARLALVLHMVRSCSGEEGVEPLTLDETSMASGIRLAEWFKYEMRRVYAILGETEVEEENRRLVEWIRNNGGTTTVREVRQKCRWLRDPGRAEKALKALVGSGAGKWDGANEGQRGRPAQRFVLVD
jgi:hypothetical protein